MTTPHEDALRTGKIKDATKGRAVFQLYKDAKGEWRWRFKNTDGVIVAAGGDGYTSKAGALNAIEAVKRDAPSAPVDDKTGP